MLDDNDWQMIEYFTSPSKDVISKVKYILQTKFPKNIRLARRGSRSRYGSTKWLPEVATFIIFLDPKEIVDLWQDLAPADYAKKKKREQMISKATKNTKKHADIHRPWLKYRSNVVRLPAGRRSIFEEGFMNVWYEKNGSIELRVFHKFRISFV